MGERQSQNRTFIVPYIQKMRDLEIKMGFLQETSAVCRAQSFKRDLRQGLGTKTGSTSRPRTGMEGKQIAACWLETKENKALAYRRGVL